MTNKRRIPQSTLHPALLAPGMTEAAMIHDVGEDVLAALVDGARDVQAMRGQPVFDRAPSYADLIAWGKQLPTERAAELWKTIIESLRDMHAEVCPLLAERTGMPPHIDRRN